MQPVDNTAPRVPGYELRAILGQTGMSTVYLALQESLNRQVALKVMNPALLSDPDFAKRFLNEGRFIAQFSHPSIVTVYDIGIHGQHYYLSMSYLPGGTLKERIRDRLPLDQGLAIVRTVAGALGYAHAKGIVHRDIKPGNVLFDERDAPVLTDFGIAKAVDADTQITSLGTTLGSVPYMSPEQAAGDDLDHRSDLYSLGVVFWEVLTGGHPFKSKDPFALALKHASAQIPTLPPPLAALQPIMDRLLAKAPGDRYQSAAELIAALDGVRIPQDAPGRDVASDTAGHATRRRRRQPWSQTGDTASVPRPPRLPRHALAAVALILAVAAGSYFAYTALTPDGNDAPPAPPTAAVAAPKPPTADAADTDRQATDAPPPVAAAPSVADLLARARRQRQETKLTAPPGDNAFESLRAVLAIQPDNGEAKDGLLQIGRLRLLLRYRAAAQEAVRSGRPREAQEAIAIGLRLAPDDPDLLALKAKLALPGG